MTEVFKPRENMTYNKVSRRWCCRDADKKFICDGGPSIIWEDGSWSFYTDRKGSHRLEGPATSDGQWWIHGKYVTFEIRQFAEENDIDLNNLTDADKVFIALKFG